MTYQNLYTTIRLRVLDKGIKSIVSPILIFVLIAFAFQSTHAQKQCDQIKLNQVGFYPNSSKLAFVTCSSRGEAFYLVSVDGNDTVYEGSLGQKRKSPYSSTTTRVADFTAFTIPGNYILRIDNKQSFPFEIGNDVYVDLGKAVLKSFYYQRSSIALEDKYAGKWNRDATHATDVMMVHPSTFADGRGTVIPSPGGWYDKGDFNKCIVNSGITTSTLLSSYEDFTNYFDTLRINIPESNDKVPDVLNEIIYNLRWMFTMQDPYDGGVYYKCINAKFKDGASPGRDKNSGAVQKTTAATLDYAAVMAQAGRIFRKLKTHLPGLADSCLRASSNAWLWAVRHPNIEFEQQMPDDFKTVSSINSIDRQLSDEWLWAAAEMFVTSRNRMYFDVVEQNINDSVSLPSPDNVAMLAYYTMLRYGSSAPGYTLNMLKLMKTSLLNIADDYLAHVSFNAFSTVMGQSKNDFAWGSNAIAANQGILLINAYLITGNEKYVSASMTNLDYLLGRNATGYCFVTGCFGVKSPFHPYYRLSENIGEPIPGLLVAGPYPGHNKLFFSPAEIETSYRDSDSDSETNQVSIDWNSAMVYLVNAVQAMQYELGFSSKPSSTVAVNRQP
ncbi:MAG TPA: glycoside hydrolase family 9 protein [Chitinophagaceae bacterium]